MRTNILLSAALVAAGIAAADAQQIFSGNAIGHVDVTLLPGYNLLNNPLNDTNNLISTVLPTVPDGSSLLTWNPAAQDFNQAEVYFGGWIDGDGNTSTRILDPGKAFFLQNNSGANVTITFLGDVSQGALTNRIDQNFGFYGSQVPQSGAVSSIGFPGSEGMSIYLWDPVAQEYVNPVYTYSGGMWLDGQGNPNDPMIAVAEGFVVANPNAAVNWTRTFSVNN